VRFELDSDLEFLKEKVYNSLNLIRIYTKPPGKNADFNVPVVLPYKSTVLDAAYDIHKDFADKMKYSKLWRGDKNPRQVGPEEILMEGDVVEFHSR
jgi:ribosome-interacting GTPase 1